MTTFDDIVAPLGGQRFLAENLGQRPLHLEGTPEKFASVMSWPVLNRLLGMSSIWSAQSLPMMLDKEPIPPSAYATTSVGRDGGHVLRPDPARVQALLKRGATLVANDIDQLTPELAAFSRALEEALHGKVQANLYLSSKRKQGFRVHYDTHDVFAAHCMGEKTWMVFEGRAEHPIAHPIFKSEPQEHHDRAKGDLWKEVRLKPGDLLYLPRGQYHYALADDGACAHIAFGVTYPIGLDVMTWLFERMVQEPLARSNLPNDAAALAARLGALGSRVAEILATPEAAARMAAFQGAYHYPRDTYDLPGVIETAEERFVVRRDLRLVEEGGRCGLVRTGSREAVEVPAVARDLVAWVVARESFARDDLQSAFTREPAARLDRFVADMQRMQVIAPAA